MSSYFRFSGGFNSSFNTAVSYGNSMRVVFQADGLYPYRGFHATYQTVTGNSTECLSVQFINSPSVYTMKLLMMHVWQVQCIHHNVGTAFNSCVIHQVYVLVDWNMCTQIHYTWFNSKTVWMKCCNIHQLCIISNSWHGVNRTFSYQYQLCLLKLCRLFNKTDYTCLMHRCFVIIAEL